MDIAVNYWAVLACGIASMIIGFVWFGPLFGKKWSKIIGVRGMDTEEFKKMQKSIQPYYAISFVLSLFQAYILSYFITLWLGNNPVWTALIIWAAFIIPTVAAGAMWNNEPKSIAGARFRLQAGYYLVLFVVFALILNYWK